jgi:hypothetical protein
MERHPFDAVSFVFGLLYLGVSVLLVTGTAGAIPMNWVGPFVAIGLGVVILVAAWPRRARTEELEETKS